MNKRQKKKNFKKRFGFNLPKNINIKAAIQIMKGWKIIRMEILHLWEVVKRAALEAAKLLKNIGIALIKSIEKIPKQHIAVENTRTRLLLQNQEKEKERIESNFNIYHRDRR